MNRRLSLRTRLTVLTGLAVAIAVAACATLSWYLARDQLHSQLDRTLKTTPSAPRKDTDQALETCHETSPPDEESRFFRFPTQVLMADGSGRRCVLPGSDALVVTAADREVVAGRPEVLHRGSSDDGTPMRIFTRHMKDGKVVSTALPLDEVQRPLDQLALLLALVAAVGVVGAATAGLVIARTALRPVDKLTEVVERIASTEDLPATIPVEGKDEIARLGRSFNTMTTALAAARDHQKRLIVDAGHELRTPLTSLRTNIDLLVRSHMQGRALPVDTRDRLLVSVKAQLHELSSLVADLLELARPTRNVRSQEVVAFHEVVGRAIERARLRGLDVRFDTKVEPWYVRGDAGSLERAVVNLLDNAVKFSPHGGVVAVRLRGGELTVRDHGPGIPEDQIPHVFERFWRSPSARSMPGSGLGLSIVALVAKECGGEASLARAAGGGTIARISLPGVGSDSTLFAPRGE